MGEPNYEIPPIVEEELKKIQSLKFSEFNKYIWKNYGKKFDLEHILELTLFWGLSFTLFLVSLLIFSLQGPDVPLLSIFQFITVLILTGIAITIFTVRRFEFSRKFIKKVKRIFPTIFIILAVVTTILAIIFASFQYYDLHLVLIASVGYFSAVVFTATLITTHPRLYSAGIIRMFSLLLIDGLTYEVRILPFFREYLDGLYEGWDKWLAEHLNLRVRNRTALQESCLNPLLFNTEELLQRVKNILNQDFFDYLKNWQSWESPLKISVALKSLSTEEPDIGPDSFVFNLKQSTTTLVAIISSALGWITAILAIFQVI